MSDCLTPTLKLKDDAFLRVIEASDVTHDYVAGLNNPRINKYLLGPRAHKQTMASVQEFVEENLKASDALLFGLYIENELCGTLRLHDIHDDLTFIGLAIFKPERWGFGWASLMLNAISDFALDELKVGAVRAIIDSSNIASQSAFSKAGFVRLKPLSHVADHGQYWGKER